MTFRDVRRYVRMYVRTYVRTYVCIWTNDIYSPSKSKSTVQGYAEHVKATFIGTVEMYEVRAIYLSAKFTLVDHREDVQVVEADEVALTRIADALLVGGQSLVQL